MDDRRDRPLEVDEGGGPPLGTAWTLEVVGDEAESADLEHAAPLPRIGEGIELIRADGSRRRLRVRDVIHVLQPTAPDRPPVREEERGPNATVSETAALRSNRLLRAGLPRVVAVQFDDPETPGEA